MNHYFIRYLTKWIEKADFPFFSVYLQTDSKLENGKYVSVKKLNTSGRSVFSLVRDCAKWSHFDIKPFSEARCRLRISFYWVSDVGITGCCFLLKLFLIFLLWLVSFSILLWTTAKINLMFSYFGLPLFLSVLHNIVLYLLKVIFIYLLIRWKHIIFLHYKYLIFNWILYRNSCLILLHIINYFTVIT